jgi:hypothetical protein
VTRHPVVGIWTAGMSERGCGSRSPQRGAGLGGAGQRGCPDCGDQLLAGGYRGYVGLEYMPTRADTFDWLPRAERGAHNLRVESLTRHTGMGIQ